MNIMNFFGKVFGSTIESQVVEKPTKEPVKTYKSRWGYHPVSYETFLKLKELNKWYHMTLKHLGCWVRWNRKTVHKHGPEPKYCPVFVEDRMSWWYTPSGQCKIYPKTRTDHGIHEAYHEARMPKTTPKEVRPLEISDEEINRLHAETLAWFRENL